MTKIVSNNYLAELLSDTHGRTLELLTGLDQNQLMGPKLPIVNPLLWEIGHVAWFYEQFILRMLYGYEPVLPDGDAIYDSIAIGHDVRWDLPLLAREECLRYIDCIRNKLLDRLSGEEASEQDSFIYQFAAFHQDMHNEAYSYSRQTLAYPAPEFKSAAHLQRDDTRGPLPGNGASSASGKLLASTVATPSMTRPASVASHATRIAEPSSSWMNVSKTLVFAPPLVGI